MDVFWQTEPQHHNKYGALPSRQSNPRSTCIACMFPEDEGHWLSILSWSPLVTLNVHTNLKHVWMFGWKCVPRVSMLSSSFAKWWSTGFSTHRQAWKPSNCERCTCSAGYVITVSIRDSSKYSLWCHSMRYPAVENGLRHQRHRWSQTGYRCS